MSQETTEQALVRRRRERQALEDLERVRNRRGSSGASLTGALREGAPTISAVLDTLTFGHGPTLAAGIETLVDHDDRSSWRTGYEDHLARETAQARYDAAHYNAARTAGQVAGVVVPMVLTGGESAAATAAGKAGPRLAGAAARTGRELAAALVAGGGVGAGVQHASDVISGRRADWRRDLAAGVGGVADVAALAARLGTGCREKPCPRAWSRSPAPANRGGLTVAGAISTSRTNSATAQISPVISDWRDESLRTHSTSTTSFPTTSGRSSASRSPPLEFSFLRGGSGSRNGQLAGNTGQSNGPSYELARHSPRRQGRSPPATRLPRNRLGQQRVQGAARLRDVAERLDHHRVQQLRAEIREVVAHRLYRRHCASRVRDGRFQFAYLIGKDDGEEIYLFPSFAVWPGETRSGEPLIAGEISQARGSIWARLGERWRRRSVHDRQQQRRDQIVGCARNAIEAMEQFLTLGQAGTDLKLELGSVPLWREAIHTADGGVPKR